MMLPDFDLVMLPPTIHVYIAIMSYYTATIPDAINGSFMASTKSLPLNAIHYYYTTCSDNTVMPHVPKNLMSALLHIYSWCFCMQAIS